VFAGNGPGPVSPFTIAELGDRWATGGQRQPL